MADLVGVRAGVLDDQSLLDTAPQMEVYVDRRPKYMQPIEGAVQLNSKYQILGGLPEGYNQTA